MRLIPLVCALLMTLANAALAQQKPKVQLHFNPDDQGVALFIGSKQLTGPTILPDLTVYYADTPDIWQARAWIALKPEPGLVTKTKNGVTVEAKTFGGKPISAKLTARVDEATNEVVWSLKVKNSSTGTVVGVRGPAIQLVRDQPDGALYIPDRPGQKLPDPWKALKGNLLSEKYPVPASMQYVAYSGSDGGVALHVRDTKMLHKFFTLGGPDNEMGVTQFPFIAPGGSWSSPPIVWQALSTDWHEAADHYRAWFRTWAAKPQISPQVKAMPVIGGVVILARPVDDANLKDVQKKQEVGTYAAALERMKQLKEGGFEGAQLVGWFGKGHDTSYPDHVAADIMGGRDGLIALADGMHHLGMLISYYLNARLANQESATFKAHPDWETIMEGGQRWEERYGDQTFRLMCPACPGFQNHMVGEVTRVVKEYKGDGAQLDQVGAAASVLCFNKSHGHSTPASAWGEGYPKMLTEIRTQARKVNPLFWDWVEGAWEGAGQYVDMMQGGFWPIMPGAVPYPQMYRYTIPEHPFHGDARMGNVPHWCPTDIHRAKKIDAPASTIFWNGDFRDDIGLKSTPSAEVHWFRYKQQALLTVVNSGGSSQSFELSLTLLETGNKGEPKSAKALSSGEALPVHAANGIAAVTVEVPAGQVEAVLLDWRR